MGCRVIRGTEAGHQDEPAPIPDTEIFFCSTDGIAFGPLMDEDTAEPFARWLEKAKGVDDPRAYMDRPRELQRFYNEWQTLYEAGEIRDDEEE